VHPAEAEREHVMLSVRPCQRLSVRRLSALVRARSLRANQTG
jgi:hypothetical protein